MFGYLQKEWLGQNLTKTIGGLGPKDPQWESILEIPVRKSLQLEARKSDGTTFPIELHLVRISDDTNLSYVAYIQDNTRGRRDIDQGKKLIELLEEGRARFETVLQQMPSGVLLALAPEERIVLENQQAEAILGRSLVGTLLHERYEALPLYRLDGTRYQGGEFPLARALKGEIVRAEEAYYARSGKSRTTISFSASPIRDRVGKITGAVAVFTDITAQKEAEREMKQRALALERSNQELKQFAYVASHDLQEPLRMVASYSQLLARRYHGKLDKDADTFITYAVEGAKRMQELIRSLLYYSRVGRDDIPLEPTDTKEVLHAVISNLSSSIEQNLAQVNYGEMPVILADKVQLSQVFQNLIANGIKFRTDQAPVIQVDAQRSSDGWLFSVTDNGIGIEPEYQERIFEIFHRLHGRDKYPGAGIGLAVCKKIVGRHGGKIWVESEPGKGTTFRFNIPGASVVKPREEPPPSYPRLANATRL